MSNTEFEGTAYREPLIPPLVEASRTSLWNDIQPQVIEEAHEMFDKFGIPVYYDQTVDPYAFLPEDQEYADRVVAGLEESAKARLAAGQPTDDLILEGRPAFNSWQERTGSALTLHCIYYPEIERLGDGLHEAAFSLPLFTQPNPFNGEPEEVSAYLLLQDEIHRNGGSYDDYQRAVDKLIDFLITPIDEESRVIWQGSRDGASVRTRGISAMDYAARYLTQRDRHGKPVNIASIGCGATPPTHQLMHDLHMSGIRVEQANMLDQDPYALSAMYYLALGRDFKGTEESFANRTRILKNNLLGTGGVIDLTTLMEPGSQQVVDMLGLFEYLRDRAAISLLKRAGEVASKEDGLIVFGNMLEDRPQSLFFDHVSRWPKLERRSLEKVIELVRQAGFDPEKQLKIILPPQGVYAIYALEMNPDYSVRGEDTRLARFGQLITRAAA